MPAPGAPKRRETTIGGIAERVRWLPPCTPGPADLDGRLVHHSLAVLGEQDSAEDNFIVIRDLAITSRGQSFIRMEEEMVAGYAHLGKMTDLQVCETGGGEVAVLAGTTEGSLHLLRLRLPRTPGAGPEDMDVLEGPPAWPGANPRLDPEMQQSLLAAWVRPHRGAVAAVHMQPETKNILSVGADGGLFVLDMEQVASAAAAAAAADDGGDGDGMAVDGMDMGEQRRGGAGGAAASGGLPPGVLPYKAGSGCVGYTCGRWVDRSMFVTSRSVGGLEMWDIRCPPAPVSRSPREWGATGLGPQDRGCHACIHSLQVHPSRPDVCASGGSAGSVALWDLRGAARPLALAEADPAAGPVWEVHFDTREGAQYGADAPAGGPSSALPAVLFCTEDGALCRVSADAGAAAAAAGAGQRPFVGARPEELSWAARQSSAGAGAGPRRTQTLLAQLPVAINSFDVGGPFGSDVVAVTGRQTLVYLSPM